MKTEDPKAMPPRRLPQALRVEEIGPEPVIPESEIVDTASADVVVLGGGHAGVQCALAAAECGASVIVVEPQDIDRMHWTGEQIGTFNSRFLTERGLGGYDLDEIIAEFFRCGGYLLNHDVISMYVKNSGEMIDHMIYDVVGLDADVLRPGQWNVHEAYNTAQYPVVTGGCKSWAGTIEFRGSLIEERIEEREKMLRVNANSRLSEFEMYALERSRELGVRWMSMQRAEVLTREGGRVTGVIAKDRGGKYHRYLANKGVALCSGSHAGGGQKLGLWAGGVIENTPSHSPVPHDAARSFGMSSFLLLNDDGERFVNESVPYALGYAMYRQPKGRICSVTDSKWLQQIRTNGIHHGNPDFGIPEYIEQCAEDMLSAVDSPVQPYGVRSCSTSERELWPIYAARTLEGLADLLGYEGEARDRWFTSIARYNEMCNKGHDDDYGKDAKTLIPVDEGPFYAGMHENERMISDEPEKGFMVNKQLAILDENGRPVPGLYAGGICVGGRHAIYYPTPVAGNYIGMSMTHGRWLGKHLAEI